MNLIALALHALHQRIALACEACGRTPQSLRVIAVSKHFDASCVATAYAAGQRDFGENYQQEALDKIAALPFIDLCWHFIGPLQANKTRGIAEHFDWVHSVDRLRIAQRLSQQRPAALAPLNVCVQVNISDEASKSGCAPHEALALCREIAQLPQLRLRGLMAIPAPVPPDGDARAPYRALRELFEQIRAALAAPADFDTLSAGMTDDLEAAVAEGATMLRVGTAIFGSRLVNSQA